MVDNPKTILIIDDEKDACDFIKSFLEERGYIVNAAYNGNDGIESIKNKAIVIAAILFFRVFIYFSFPLILSERKR